MSGSDVTPPADRIPWWLVPNLLALDAPAVAVVWQRFLASRFGVPLHFPISVTLALTVWGIYLLDRGWDARRGQCDTERHRWAGRHHRLILGLTALAFLAVGTALAFLPVDVVTAGAAVAAGVAGYLGTVHWVAPRLVASHGFKELLVGIGFAAGVTVPLLASPHFRLAWLLAVAAFGGVCWLNCRLIDRWESRQPAGAYELALAAGALSLGVAAPTDVTAAIAGALALLLAVHLLLGHRRPRAARVLADVVLLVPLAAWI